MESALHPEMYYFLCRFRAVVCATLLPVVLTAFFSIPFDLGGYPGNPRSVKAISNLHLT